MGRSCFGNVDKTQNVGKRKIDSRRLVGSNLRCSPSVSTQRTCTLPNRYSASKARLPSYKLSLWLSSLGVRQVWSLQILVLKLAKSRDRGRRASLTGRLCRPQDSDREGNPARGNLQFRAGAWCSGGSLSNTVQAATS